MRWQKGLSGENAGRSTWEWRGSRKNASEVEEDALGRRRGEGKGVASPLKPMCIWAFLLSQLYLGWEAKPKNPKLFFISFFFFLCFFFFIFYQAHKDREVRLGISTPCFFFICFFFLFFEKNISLYQFIKITFKITWLR